MSELTQDLFEGSGAAFDAEPEMALNPWRPMIDEWPQGAARARPFVGQSALAGEVG